MLTFVILFSVCMNTLNVLYNLVIATENTDSNQNRLIDPFFSETRKIKIDENKEN